MNFKKALAIILVFACLFTMLTSCGSASKNDPAPTEEESEQAEQTDENSEADESLPENFEENSDKPLLPDIELKNLGEDLEAAGIANGKFDGTTTNTDFTVTYISGTENAYTYDDSKKTLTFSALSADSVYSISGKLNGNIIIDVGENHILGLELAGFSLRSETSNPILINSGKEIKIAAKISTKNYIYDERNAIDSANSELYSAAIHSTTDLTLDGAGGELFVQSAQNNGIQSEKNLKVTADLSLVIECNDGALKGKNNVMLENCSTLLVAKSGDAIKTEATNISPSSNQHNGTVSIIGGTHNIFASNDGIEAAYDVIIDNGTFYDSASKEEKTVATIINIYTDKYSSYTDSKAHDKPDLETRPLYVCYTSDKYKYSVKLSNADGTKSEWVDPTFNESIKSGRRTYYTYKFYAKPEYTKMQVFIYSEDQALQNEETYYAKSDLVDIKADSDTYRYSSGNRRWEWKTYASLSQSGNRPNESANPDAVSYSTKGIKGANSITVKAGTLKINSVDNAIGTNSQVKLESGKMPAGDITVTGGDITVNTKCNGLYSDNALNVTGGSIKILTSFEGIKGNTVTVTDGDISINSTNNGLSSSAKTGTGVTVAGGMIYINAGAHGIHSSSSSSYSAIAFDGGDTVIIAPADGKAAINSDGGYKYSNGRVLIIMSKNGNKDTTTHCYTFSKVGKIQEIELTENTYVNVGIDGDNIVSAKVLKTLSAIALYIGDKSVEISSAETIDATANSNGVCWYESL